MVDVELRIRAERARASAKEARQMAEYSLRLILLAERRRQSNRRWLQRFREVCEIEEQRERQKAAVPQGARPSPPISRDTETFADSFGPSLEEATSVSQCQPPPLVRLSRAAI